MGWNDGIMKKSLIFVILSIGSQKKIPAKTSKNVNFKPIFMRFLATASGAKIRDAGTIKLRFCFKISLVVIK